MKKLFIIILLIIGIFFRSYQPGLYIFGFDQVQILTNAELIKQGNMTLIGPRTGPAEMFTGPLIYYITALFLFVFGSPWSIVATSTLIAAFTGFSLFYLIRKYISIESALVALIIWTFSPFLIRFDRIAWNPDLTFLASSLVFFPMLGYLKQKKVSSVDLILIFIGSFLGFQAHFSGLLLPVMLFLTLVVFKKFSIKLMLVSGLGLATSILPSLIFDYRHGWLNARGLISFLSEKETIGGTLFFGRFVHSLQMASEIFGSFSPFELERNVSIYLGLLFLSIVIWKFAKKQVENYTNTAVSFFWVSTVIVIFSFYRSNAPEYYFFIFLPALFVFASDLLEPNKKIMNFQKSLIILILSILSFYSIINFESIVHIDSPKVNSQLNIARDIASHNTRDPIAKVAYDILEVDTIGMRYFIDKLVTLSDVGKTVHISQTNDKNTRYDQYGLWLDPRTEQGFQYIVSNDVVLKMPENIRLLEDRYQGAKYGPHESFQIASNDELTGDILVLVRYIGNPFIVGNETFLNLKKHVTQKETENGWKQIIFESYSGYLKEYENYILVYVTDKTPIELYEISALSIKPGILY